MLNIVQQSKPTDFGNFVFLVTLLFGVALGKIYFEEGFNDDLWSQRWVASKDVAKNFGTYRTAGRFFANANNTALDSNHFKISAGLRTSNDKRLYYFSTLFPEFTNENKNLVLQYSVKYEQDVGEAEVCAEAHIKLFNCDLHPIELSRETPYLIMFGPAICEQDQRFHVVFSDNNNITPKGKKKISWKYDAFTHMYTLIVQPNKTYSVLIDDVEVGSGVTRNKPIYPRICGIGFQLWQEHSGTIFDNILVTDELAVAKERRRSIGDWQAAEHRMKDVPQEDERERSHQWRNMTHEERKAEIAARNKAREEEKAALIEAARKAEADSHEKLMLTIYISTSLAVSAIVIVIISAYLVFRYRSKYLLTREEVNKFLRGNPDVENHPENDGILEGSGKAENQPYNKGKYEIPTSSFNIDTTRYLGSGEFGIVCFGYIERGDEQVNVAVKMTNQQGANNLALKGLISEIKILSYVGDHQNILRLEGAHTAKLRMGKVYVFLELCELGSLEKKLRSYKPEQKILNEYADLLRVPLKQDAMEMGVRDQLLLSEEMSQDHERWTKEIASAMEYLASKRIVHADLATRNVLLNSRKCVKIADFGLSRRLYTYTEYQKSESEPLPWRWMAPESLRKLTFNEKTDVWAFGVTLWEMITLGDQPYPGLVWDVNFAASLEQGLSLPEPKYNQGNIYSVMKRCWEIMPSDRPTFSELTSILA